MIESGRALGSRYDLIEKIGHGASGVVWRVWDRRDQKPVAAKILWPHYAHDEEVLTRFVRERTILMSLRHPSIVNVTDLVVEGDDLAIIMDLVQGPSLAAVLRQSGALRASIAVGYVSAVLDALAHAHSKGVLHRDVKTDNILLATADHPGPHDVRLADFGVARLTHETAARTETIGTPYYMSPELISYGKSGPESDVYAAGIVLYELLAGRTPFAGAGTNATISLRHLRNAPPTLDIPPALQSVLDTMLAKDPAHRRGAADTAEALRGIPASDLLDVALPVQPEPDHWEPTTQSLPSKSEVEATLGYQLVAARDVSSGGTTSQKARQPLRQPSSDSLPPAETEPVDTGGLTRIKTAPTQDEPSSPEPEVRKKKRLPLIIGLSAGVVLLATVLVLWLTGTFNPSSSAPIERPVVTTAAAHVTGDTLPTGLRLDLDAAWDAADQAVSLTVTLAATPASGLTGDILIDIPPLSSDGACPTVTAAPPATIDTLKASTDGFTGVCAHKLTDVLLAPGATERIELRVDLDMWAVDGQPPTDYGQWLSHITDVTDQDLRDLAGVEYPLQRVTAVTVVIDSVSLTETDATPVPYTVEAQWLGGSEGTPPPTVFTDETITGMETVLLTSLTGGAGLDGVRVDGCDATITSGVRLLARQPTNNCEFQVRVGSLSTPTARFAIVMR